MADGISKKSILRLSPDRIVADTEYNGRRYHDTEIEDMTMRILEAGKLLQPIGVSGPYKSGEHKGKYRLCLGFRRYQSMCDIIGGELAPAENEDLAMIDCSLISADPLDHKAAYLANLAENYDRKAVSPMDDAVNLVKLIDEFGLTNAEAAKQLGMKPSLASQRKPLASLPISIHKYIADGTISASVGYELSRQPAERVQEMADRLVAEAKAAGGKGRVTRDAMAEAVRGAEGEKEEDEGEGGEGGEDNTATAGPEGQGQGGEGETPAPAKRAKAVLKPRSIKAALNFMAGYKITKVRSEKGLQQLVVEWVEKVFQGVREEKLKKEFDEMW